MNLPIITLKSIPKFFRLGMFFRLTFSFLLITSFLKAQTIDSVLVTGELVWSRNSITTFPASLTVKSRAEHTYTKEIEVDSLGHFSIHLLPGNYLIQPTLNYHWEGEHFIRINESNSKLDLTLTRNQKIRQTQLRLDTIAKPVYHQAKGLLLDFDLKQSEYLDQFVKDQLAYFDIPGASLALIKGGELIYHQVYGVKNKHSQEPVDQTTLFEAGSITKPVFAFVVMRLVEQGAINLDKPLYQYLEFKAISHDDRHKLITARHVLSHQTGFPNWAKRDENGQFDLLFTPGTQFGYSGEGFEYLKRVVEVVTQKKIEVLLEEQLLMPLQLSSLYFSVDTAFSRGVANGHRRGQPSSKRIITRPMMAYSMNTEAKAFAGFMLALRNKEGLKIETYKALFKVNSTRSDGTHWGLGFRLEDTKVGRSYGHSGSTGKGFISNYTYYPDLDIGFVVFTNSQLGGMFCLPILTAFLITGHP